MENKVVVDKGQLDALIGYVGTVSAALKLLDMSVFDEKLTYAEYMAIDEGYDRFVEPLKQEFESPADFVKRGEVESFKDQLDWGFGIDTSNLSFEDVKNLYDKVIEKYDEQCGEVYRNIVDELIHSDELSREGVEKNKVDGRLLDAIERDDEGFVADNIDDFFAYMFNEEWTFNELVGKLTPAMKEELIFGGNWNGDLGKVDGKYYYHPGVEGLMENFVVLGSRTDEEIAHYLGLEDTYEFKDEVIAAAKVIEAKYAGDSSIGYGLLCDFECTPGVLEDENDYSLEKIEEINGIVVYRKVEKEEVLDGVKCGLVEWPGDEASLKDVEVGDIVSLDLTDGHTIDYLIVADRRGDFNAINLEGIGRTLSGNYFCIVPEFDVAWEDFVNEANGNLGEVCGLRVIGNVTSDARMLDEAVDRVHSQTWNIDERLANAFNKCEEANKGNETKADVERELD